MSERIQMCVCVDSVANDIRSTHDGSSLKCHHAAAMASIHHLSSRERDPLTLNNEYPAGVSNKRCIVK